MQEATAKNETNGAPSAVQSEGNTGKSVSESEYKKVADACPERGGSSDPSEVVNGGRQPPTTTLGVFGGESDFPPPKSETAEQSLSPAMVINCSHPESGHQNAKVCTRLNVPCISRKGYTCLHSGTCQPCNAEGEVLTDAGCWTAYPRRGGMVA